MWDQLSDLKIKYSETKIRPEILSGVLCIASTVRNFTPRVDGKCGRENRYTEDRIPVFIVTEHFAMR